ncbi:DUF2231 domain-containing protein [Cupriavidus necator]|uniref:DUF2231 domain-containing protein n=1 Tax=Cupriavidus necator TaxID=106590 RepID=UPI001E4FE70C|nr:DUF2231 domain-containing protein [Cupriavidus necator]
MRTPASNFGHPIHPMLVAFPLGLWIFSLACDLIRAGPLATRGPPSRFTAWLAASSVLICAAVPGFIDLVFHKWDAPSVKQIALIHIAINLTVVALYAINIWLPATGPSGESASMSIPVLLSIVAVGLLFVSGWLAARWSTFTA